MSVFNWTNIYTVHAKPGGNQSLEKPVFVREGFSFWAFVFTFIWALYYRLWAFAAVIVIGDAVIGVLGAAHLLHPASLGALQLAFSFLIGSYANDARRMKLKAQGYITADISVADSLLRAEQRYFERYLANAAA